MTTFDDFYYSDNTDTALSINVLQNIANSLAEGSPPENRFILLTGNHGAGKTHLINALYDRVTTAGRSVLKYRANEFLEEFIAALKENRLTGFRNKIKSLDLLIIENIELSVKKDGIQEELSGLINYFIDNNRSMILTMENGFDIRSLENAFQSKIDTALHISVSFPDDAACRRYIEDYLNQCGLGMTKEVIERLLSYCNNKIPLLKQKLIFCKEFAVMNKIEHINNPGIILNEGAKNE